MFWLIAVSSVAGAATLVTANEAALPPADLNQPSAVALDGQGRMYVLDGTRSRVVVMSANGSVVSTFGQQTLKAPLDLAVTEEGIVVADTGHHRLAVFRTDGSQIKTIELPLVPCLEKPAQEPSLSTGNAPGRVGLAHPTTGSGEQSGTLAVPGEEGLSDSQPCAHQPDAPSEPVAVAVRDGIAYTADRKGHRICRNRLDNGESLGCFGGRGETEGQFQFPFQVAFDRDGYLYAVDIVNARLQIFDKTGRYFSSLSRFGVDEGELFRPNGVAIDRDSDTVFVSDSYFGTVSVFRRGEYLGFLTGGDGKPIKLDSPTGMAFQGGRLYVAETGASRVRRLDVGYRKMPDQPETKGPRVEISQKDCVICHLSWVNGHGDEVKKPDAKGALPDIAFGMCYSCHNGAIMDSRLTIHHNDQHPTIYDSDKLKSKHREKGQRKDKFPDEFPKTAGKELTCASCHTPHTDKDQTENSLYGHRNAWMRVPNKGGDLCERCHESKVKDAREQDAKKRGRNHPLAIRLAAPPFEEAPGYTRLDKLHEGIPERVNEAGGALGHKQELICQSCHQIHGGHGEQQLLTVDRTKGELCAQCHSQQYSKSKEDAFRLGIHPVNVKPEDKMTFQDKKLEFLTCQTCHRVHSGTTGTSLLPEGIESAEALCQTCHQRQHAKDKDDARKKGVHPVNNKLDDPVEIAGKKIEKVGCLSCHSVHHGKASTMALVETDRDGQLCSHCHDNKQTVVGTDHDLRITAKDKSNRYDQKHSQIGVCGGCHTLHRGKGDQIRLFAARIVQRQSVTESEKLDDTDFRNDGLCLNCHQKGGLAEKKIVQHFSHPHQDVILRSDKNKMPLLDKAEKPAEFGAIACITCHEPHLWKHGDKRADKGKSIAVSTNKENQEGRNISSFLRHKGVSGTFCVDCHGMEGLVKYKYYHDKKRARSKGVDYLK